MISHQKDLRLRYCRMAEIGIAHDRFSQDWPVREAVSVSLTSHESTHYVLAVPGAALAGALLTTFLDRVAPFGCPPAPSLIRAYGLPDSLFPSVLLKEHEEAPDGVSDSYRRFVDRSRQQWLGALQETGPGLSPVLAWQTQPARQFLGPDEWAEALAQAGVALPGVADDYLGRGLLLVADPDLAASWQTMMSLGGPTKARKITGREFPVWVDLAAHQPALLASPLLDRVERLFSV
ncbi:MAG TPA: hypothetical protein VMS64_19125 [Candidatus Methylomirabilis sp.]|nr:hypothetical protein [Candidatus Methylomirabilis sp.]